MERQLTIADQYLAEIYFLVALELEDKVRALHEDNDEFSDITEDFNVYLAPSALRSMFHDKIDSLQQPMSADDFYSWVLQKTRAFADEEFKLQYAKYKSKKEGCAS